MKKNSRTTRSFIKRGIVKGAKIFLVKYKMVGIIKTIGTNYTALIIFTDGSESIDCVCKQCFSSLHMEIVNKPSNTVELSKAAKALGKLWEWLGTEGKFKEMKRSEIEEKYLEPVFSMDVIEEFNEWYKDKELKKMKMLN